MATRTYKKFEVVTHGPFTADIRLNTEQGMFSCKYGDYYFESQILTEVRAWARAKLRELSALKWQPVMAVNFDSQDDRVNNLNNCANLRCYLERFYIAWDGQQWLQTPWVVMPRGTWLAGHNYAVSEMDQANYPMPDQELMEQRIAQCRVWCPMASMAEHLTFPLINPNGLGSATYFVPFTEERWATLIGILDKIRELRARMHQLLGCDAGWTQLAVIAGTRLLAAPDKAPKP